MLTETLERIRLTANISRTDWCELLNIGWMDYQRVKAGEIPLSEDSLENLAQKFQLSGSDIRSGKLDFTQLALKTQDPTKCLPERYTHAAYGRRRSSGTAVQFLEDKIGWRLRNDVLHRFDIPEGQLEKSFEPISVLFMTDLCSYLFRRGFRKEDFSEMGAYNYEMTKDTLVGRHFSKLRDAGEVYESFFAENMKLFEENCTYTLTKLSLEGGEFEVTSNKDVTEEIGSRHVGSPHLCAFKAGFASSLPRFLGLPKASVRETACVHLGDSCCRFEFTYLPSPAQIKLLSS